MTTRLQGVLLLLHGVLWLLLWLLLLLQDAVRVRLSTLQGVRWLLCVRIPLLHGVLWLRVLLCSFVATSIFLRGALRCSLGGRL